jgi:hypothetical protein
MFSEHVNNAIKRIASLPPPSHMTRTHKYLQNKAYVIDTRQYVHTTHAIPEAVAEAS